MKKYSSFKKVTSSVVIGFILLGSPINSLANDIYPKESIVSEKQDIDEGIFNLNYDKREILASKGELIEKFVPKEGKLSKDKFIVVERNKKSLNTSPVDISIIDSMIDRTYPGALQLVNEDFLDNRPNLLSVKRNPINISIDLPGLKKDNTIKVENPTYGNVNGAIDTLINNWSKEYSGSHTLPSRIQYSESMVHSESQLASSLNVNAKTLKDSLAIDFDAIKKGEKKVMIAAYKQIFYTVNAELPNNPSDLFNESVTYRDLTRRGVSDNTPPVMVSNVAYGRTIYVKLETDSKEKNVESAFKALMRDGNIDANSKYEDVLNNSTFTAVVLGGDAQTHNKVVTKDFDVIKKVIEDGAEFSLKNPAYPISYTSVFLKDNSVAAIHNKTDYIETSSKEYNSGKINIDHRGAYVAQFEISWDEVSYDEEGNELIEHKSWDGNWKDRTARFTSSIYLPANATNIRIYGRECTGLSWEWWRTVVDEHNVPLNKNIKLYMGGTTLNPSGGLEFK